MNEDLISVIVPIYNVDKYLNVCLDSIISQSYTNLEIILVDDGSKDNCSKICDEYASKDKRIKVIHKENGGLSSARNAGLDICKGEYIAFVDSDDCVLPDFIKQLHDLIIKHNVELSFCDYYRGKTVSEIIDNDTTNEIMELDNEQFQEYLILKNYTWNKMYHKSLFENIRFPVGKAFEDIFIMYKIASKVDKTCGTTKKLYLYRINENSISGSFLKDNRKDYYEGAEQRLAFFKETNNKLFTKQLIEYLINLRTIQLEGLTKNIDNDITKLAKEKYQSYLKEYKQEIDKYASKSTRFKLYSFLRVPKLYSIIYKLKK